MVNRLLPENRKYIPNVFNGKKTFQKCNPPDFKFYLDKLNNKIFPIWCNVNFVSVFTALNNTKKQQQKFNITPYGENFHLLTYWDKIKKKNKIKSGGLHFLKVFCHFKILGWSTSFRAIDNLPCAH